MSNNIYLIKKQQKRHPVNSSNLLLKGNKALLGILGWISCNLSLLWRKRSMPVNQFGALWINIKNWVHTGPHMCTFPAAPCWCWGTTAIALWPRSSADPPWPRSRSSPPAMWRCTAFLRDRRDTGSATDTPIAAIPPELRTSVQTPVRSPCRSLWRDTMMTGSDQDRTYRIITCEETSTVHCVQKHVHQCFCRFSKLMFCHNFIIFKYVSKYVSVFTNHLLLKG